MDKIIKKIMLGLLNIILIFSLASCNTNTDQNTPDDYVLDDGKNNGNETNNNPTAENDKTLVFDFTTSIDKNSIVEEGQYTIFTATADNGMVLRFQGININILDTGISMKQNSMLFNLDYIGQIQEFQLFSKSLLKLNIGYGFGFTNVEKISTVEMIKSAIIASSSIKSKLNIAKYNTGFFAARLDSVSAVISELAFTYDNSIKQTLLRDLDTTGSVYQTLINKGVKYNEMVVDIDIAENEFTINKINDENVITSDIIEGIDKNSITKSGNEIHFSSVMSNGDIVRFEAENIEINDKGILIKNDSRITSLDALGKIYAYNFKAADYESSIMNTSGIYMEYGYGYTYSSSKINVDYAYEVHKWSIGLLPSHCLSGEVMLSAARYEPNFVSIKGCSYYDNSFILESAKVYYDPSEKVTGVKDVELNLDYNTAYIEGDIYDSSIEEQEDKAYESNLNFYLMVTPDTELSDEKNVDSLIMNLPSAFYDVAAMRDASGNIIDKTKPIEVGCSLDITIGDFDVSLELMVLEQYNGAYTMNDLVPNAFPSAVGDLNTLVVPVVWSDQVEMANDNTLDHLRKGIGRIIDESRNITDYSSTSDDNYSLSKYYDIASYGKLKITSFLTKWYYADEKFAEIYKKVPDEQYANDIMDWVRATYPNIDWEKYDKDANGYIDSMIIISTGISTSNVQYTISYSGAFNYRLTYYGDYAGTHDAPRVNVATIVGYNLIEDDYATIIHEFAHGLGLFAYYDVSNSGIDVVGSLDMQSASCGDWNAYSKMAVGWMDPIIIEGLESRKYVEYTIGSSALTDDVIVIPAAGTIYNGPFSEYIMIDLLTMDGTNKYLTKDFDLEGVEGVRISHVNAVMEKRTTIIESKINFGEFKEYTIGTIHYSNAYSGSERGKYNIEVIQAGKKNTFTDYGNYEDNRLDKYDLFYEGDSFTAEEYNEFLYDGLMDNGMEFGYLIEIIQIETNENGIPQATIRITAK